MRKLVWLDHGKLCIGSVENRFGFHKAGNKYVFDFGKLGMNYQHLDKINENHKEYTLTNTTNFSILIKWDYELFISKSDEHGLHISFINWKKRRQTD